jgi:hypothetical protein
MILFAIALLLPMQAGFFWMFRQPKRCQLLKGLVYVVCCLSL